jgi:hypothetical protein
MARAPLRNPNTGKYESGGQRQQRQYYGYNQYRANRETNVFTRILDQAVHRSLDIESEQARVWFRQQASRVNVTPNKILNAKEYQGYTTSNYAVGSMFLFQYDPKTKEKLPYWDQFPLVIPIGPAEGGFYGLNLHYLPPYLRARLMDALYTVTNNKRYDDSTKLVISYQILKSAAKFRYFKPCIKHYLTGHVRSRFLLVNPKEWDIALFLPLQRFQKQSQGKVWLDSSKMSNK